MFRNGLLVSTAMTAVALLLSGAPTGAFAQTDMHVASQDPNARFLCTYGQFLVSGYTSGGNHSRFSGWQHVAVPITGHGQTVSSIKIAETAASVYNSIFSVGIYSNTASGVPGKLIAGGKGKAKVRPKCGRIAVSITPTTLQPNTRYWIEETVPGGNLYWEADPNSQRRAYVQYHRFIDSSSSRFSSTSPWRKQTTGPYLQLR